MFVTSEDILGFEKRYRANLINSLLGYKPALLVGTKSNKGFENLALFTSAVHLGASPPLVGLISRPDSVDRHTLNNIRESQIYTLSHVSQDHYKSAHQSSARYQVDESEFLATGLAAGYVDNFDAPFVKESDVKIGLALKEIIPIQLNNTYLIIGQIEWIVINADHLLTDGSLDYEKLKSITVTGLDTYHSAQQLAKLPYAKATPAK